MSRFILNTPKGKHTDHINHDTLDNRKCNLRICTVAQNSFNRKLSVRNTSGYKGVSWNKELKKWYASIKFQYKSYSLGLFSNKIDATIAYNMAAKKYFGEFAYINPL